MVSKAEVLFRAGNSSGKTWGAAAICVAMARGIKRLDGTPLPDLDVPNVGWVLSQTYKSQVEAAQKAYLHWVGEWPHKVSWVAGPASGKVERIWIKTPLCRHQTDEACKNCSQIVFHCEDSEASLGGRIDWAHADEPPKESVWREMRSRKIAGRLLVRLITATPKERVRWEWMAKDFAACDLEIKRGRFEIRSSLFRNKYLTERDRQDFLDAWQGDEHLEARINGDYVDVGGSCPFNYKLLQEWKARCEIPQRGWLKVKSLREGRDGREPYEFNAPVEIWEEPQEDERYFGVVDPSLGIDDGQHDPAGLLIVARRKPRVVLRYNGYIGAYALGSLAGTACQLYNRAFLDVDTSGGYGEVTLTALADMKYHRLCQDMDPDRPGVFSPRTGFKLSRATRNELVGIVQQALVEDSVRVWSAEIVDCLMQMRMVQVPGGWKYEPAPGQHDEDLICLGRALALMAMPGYRLSGEPREVGRDPRTPWEAALAHLKGHTKVRGRAPAPIVENWR